MEKKALIAMSGGVDSSAAACLIQRAGYDCGGAIMRLWPENAEAAVEDARAVAQKLGMPFHVLDASEPFRQLVVEDFIRCYEAGLTPNPCIRCNRRVKFDTLLEEADRQGGAEAVREAGLRFAVRQIRRLLDEGAPGIHLYTLNKADLCLRLRQETGL